MSDLITPALIAICILFAGWYFLGLWFNRRRGVQLARLLRERLKTLQVEELTGRWVNAAIFQFVAKRAGAPIGKLAALLVLESRELPLIWLANLLRGKHDLLVLRMDLRAAPMAELEAYSQQTRPEREVRQRIAEQSWEHVTMDDYMIYHQQEAAQLLEALTPLLKKWQPYLQRVSISSSSPHLLLSFSPAPPVLKKETGFTAVQKLAEAAAPPTQQQRPQKKKH
jgi:hypothetical protein